MNLFTLTDGRNKFYQWDSGRQLIINEASINEVHFCNGSSDSSIVREVFEQDGKRLVNVPNILLQDTRSITVFAYVKDSSGGYTYYSELFGVRARTKPDGYTYTEVEVLDWKELDKRIDEIEKNAVSSKQIANAVRQYLQENPINAGSTASIGLVDLLADKWVASASGENLYSQEVTIYGVPENFDFASCQVDLTPSVEQLVVFYAKDLTFVTENEDGNVTVYVIGQKPTNDYTIQVTITEVEL